ncbi:MAG: ECF-type sigma factor [Pirellulales bacterium]
MNNGSSHGSVTRIYHDLQTGDQDAARQLWLRFFARTVALARRRLEGVPRQVRDEEDVALSAFESLCRGAAHGRFPAVMDRESLWRLLVTITARKASDEAAYQRRGKRDARRELHAAPSDDGGSDLMARLVSHEPSPSMTAQLTEEVARLLDALPAGDLREIALLKMEGYTNAEIAHKLDRGLATVARKLQTIRALWSEWT